MYYMPARRITAEVIRNEADRTSYRDLSKRLKLYDRNCNLSPSTLCRIANNEKELTLTQFCTLLNYFNLSPDDLLIVSPF